MDRKELAELRVLLWLDAQLTEQLQEVDEIVTRGTNGNLPVALLVSQDEHGALTGFLEVRLRSHADGWDPTRSVGFVEGWFVRAPFRNRGVGRELMRAAEDWARSQGCVEMASDALIENEASQHAHEPMGFDVVDRCVHFRKLL